VLRFQNAKISPCLGASVVIAPAPIALMPETKKAPIESGQE